MDLRKALWLCSRCKCNIYLEDGSCPKCGCGDFYFKKVSKKKRNKKVTK